MFPNWRAKNGAAKVDYSLSKFFLANFTEQLFRVLLAITIDTNSDVRFSSEYV